MKMTLLPLLLGVASMLLSGCDTMSGVSRHAVVHTVPDLVQVKAHIESFPEIREVKVWQKPGPGPLTLSGQRKFEEIYYLSYAGGENVHGTLMFTKNDRAVMYDQYLIDMNRRPPQPWIDATWPVMKKIERDLEEIFGLTEIPATLKTSVVRVEDPERTPRDQSR